MDLHNTLEDIVIARVNEIFESIDKEGNRGKYCTCNQCRMDIICYALNRMRPHYIVSNRGASRVKWESIERQQQVADITALVHEGFEKVNHNLRPNFSHSPGEIRTTPDKNVPVFNIPTIMGRLFNGNNFAPVSNVDVKLLLNGDLVPMKDGNWQNPCRLVHNTEGNFTFWPAAVKASNANEPNIFEYSLQISNPEYEPLIHFFKITVTSEEQAAASFSLNRTFKLPDLYMFPPGETEHSRYLDCD